MDVIQEKINDKENNVKDDNFINKIILEESKKEKIFEERDKEEKIFKDNKNEVEKTGELKEFFDIFNFSNKLE